MHIFPTRSRSAARAALALAAGVLLFASSSALGQDVEPNDTLDQANTVFCGSTISGTIGPGDPADSFRLVNVPANTVLRLDVTTEGTCLGDPNSTPCTAFADCGPDGFCDKLLDTFIVGYTAERVEIFQMDDPFSGDVDPIGTTPLRNAAPADFLFQLSALPNGAVEAYEISVACDQPVELTCGGVITGKLFEFETEGDMDVFSVTLGSAPKKASFNIDAEELQFDDVRWSFLDSLVRLYGPDWSVIAESNDNLAPNEPCLLCAESATDSYIRAHVFEPGTYYFAVTCGDDFNFEGCPDSPIDPLFEDFEYRLQRQCQNANSQALDCSGAGAFVSDELDPLPFTNPGVEVDFYSVDVDAGDLIEVDIDSAGSGNLAAVVGLFETPGHYLDGMPILLEDEPTCDFETDACNDDGVAPDDLPGESVNDSYLAFCAPRTGPVTVGVSNEGDFDFNGLDDFDNADEFFLVTQVGPYDMTVRCDRPDSDMDGHTDCLDNCPAISNPDQSDADGNGIGDVCEVDFDGDGVLNELDNCPHVANADQLDFDKNGIGNICECGDVDGNTVTNVTDALLIARGLISALDPNFGKCDVNGDGSCNVTDALEIARGEVGSDPASQLCPAYLGEPGT